MDNFAKLVTEIENLGITGHLAYSLANQVSLSVYETQESIKNIARNIIADEIATQEALADEKP